MNPARPRPHEARRRAAPLRIDRRSFLVASAAISASAAGAAVVGCRESATSSKRSDVLGGSAPLLLPAGTRGGTLRVYNFDATAYDSLDPHQTQMGPVANMHSAVFSRLLRYDDEIAGTIAPDLAAAMPEQPDATTYIMHVRDDASFHDTPRLRTAYPNTVGRALTADDVKYSIERQLSEGSPRGRFFFRRSDWDVIERIETRDARTVVITTKSPVAPFLNFLAGRHAFVVPADIVGGSDSLATESAMIGSGPFVLDSFEPGVAVKLSRNPGWFGRDDSPRGIGDGRPFLDGVDAFLSPQEDALQRAALQRRIVDASSFADPTILDSERKTNLADLALDERGGSGFLASRFLLDRAPFSDDRLRRAIHLALDRVALLDLLYPTMDGRPSAQLSGPIAPAVVRWSMADADLTRRPGYRADPAGRAEDVATARQLWSAGTGGTPLELHINFAGVPRAIPERAADATRRQLADVLGATVTAQIDPTGQTLIAAALARNAEGATEGIAAFTFAFEDGGVDLDDSLYAQFRSGQPSNSYRLQDPQVDALLDRSRAEFNAEARRRIGLDLQEYLLANAIARLEFCAPIERRLRWGYVRNARLPVGYGRHDQLADVWLDATHPAWRPR